MQEAQWWFQNVREFAFMTMTKFQIPSEGFLNMCLVPQLMLSCISSERPSNKFKVTKLLSCAGQFGSSNIFNHCGLHERLFSGRDWERDHHPHTFTLLTSFRAWLLRIRLSNAMDFLGRWQVEWWTSPYTTPALSGYFVCDTSALSVPLSCVPGDGSVTLGYAVTQRENAGVPISSVFIGGADSVCYPRVPKC